MCPVIFTQAKFYWFQSTNKIRTTSKDVAQKRKLSSSSCEEKVETKKQKIDNDVIDIDKDEEYFEPKSNLNSSKIKSVIVENSRVQSGNKNRDKRSPSPIAGTSKYFDLIENRVSKKFVYDKQEKQLPSLALDNPDATKKILDDELEKEDSAPIINKPFKKVKPQLIVKEKVSIPDSSEDVFEKILKTCKEKNNSSDIDIVSRKLKGYFNQLKPADKESEEFRICLNRYLNQILNSDRVFKPLVDIKKEILHRIDKKDMKGDDKHVESEEIELTEEDAKKVKILQKRIKECQDKIERLENEEIDFEEDDNSSYIALDRYKKKIVELFEALSRITQDKNLKKQIHKRLLKRNDIPDEMTGIICVDETILRSVNASIKEANKLKHIKNPSAIASHRLMPDYVDILQCIKQCNDEKDLDLSNKKMGKLGKYKVIKLMNFLQ